MAAHEPAVMISVIPAGQQTPVRVPVTDRVIGFEYEDVDDKADLLRITLDNHDLTDLDDPIWQKGNLIECSWGYADAMAPPRLMQIRKISGFQQLKVEAFGLEVALNTIERTRVFRNMSRSDVARRIAQSWGYNTPEKLHVEDTKVVRETIVQGKLTDAQLLRRLATKEGFEWFIDFDGFHFHRRDLAQRPIRVLSWRDPGAGGPIEIISIDIDQDPNGKRKKVSVRARDPLTRTTLVEVADQDSEKERDVLGGVQELPDSPLHNVATEAVLTTTERSAQAARRIASAKFRTSQQHAVELDVDMLGDPNLLAKSIVELRGIGKRFSGRYYVKEVKHEIRGGYTCKVKLLSDGSGGHSTKSVRAREASAIEVAPRVKGRTAPATPSKHEGIVLSPEVRKSLDAKDADNQQRIKYGDTRNREPPPKP